MYVLTECSQRKLMWTIVDHGMLSGIPNQQLGSSAYAMKLTKESAKGGGLETVSTDHYYYARISVKRFKDLCREVKSGSIRAMGVISAMYSLGFILPKSDKIGKAWHNFSYLTGSEHVEIDAAYKYLIKHAKAAIAKSEDGYLYDNSYYDQIRVFRDAFSFQEVPLKNVRNAIKERALKLKKKSKVYSYAVPKGIQTLAIYKNSRNGAKLYDVLTLVDNKIVSILDAAVDIPSIPVALSRGDIEYAKRTNTISGTAYDMFAVAGTFAVPSNMKPAVKKFLNVSSVSEIVNLIHNGQWLVKKAKSFNSRKRGIRLRNLHNPGEYVNFVATNVYGLSQKGRLMPIDLCVTLGQHLSSAGFLTVDSNPRERCLYLDATIVTTASVQETVKVSKQVADNSQYNVFAVVFRLSTTNSVNLLSRLN